MNNDWFFEKFALIADAPGAVDRMRELVLQMAIQGRLVQQDPTDEPANATLLKYPSTVSAKFIKTPDAGTPCPKITLPLGWVWNRLTNVLKKLTDGTHHSPPNSNFGEFPYVTAKNIKNHGIEISNLTYVTKELHNEIFSRCNPEHGDLLYIKDGATTGIVAINQLREEFSMLSSVALLKLTGAIDNRYLLWTLRSPFFYNQIRAAMKGAAITRVNLTELAQTWIPLPPLAEQKRIVAKVDELMGLCDELEVQQQERELRKSVLIRSSLSRFSESPTRENLGYLFHNSYDIPPSELRKSILTLAVQGKLVPFDIESTKQTVGEHIDFQNGFAFKSQWFTTTGTRLCRNVNVSHGFLDWKETVFVDEKIVGDFQRFALCEGDIVLSLDRPLIATGLKVARVTQEDLPSLLLQRVARLTPKHDQLTQSYIFLWLNSTAFVDCIAPGRSNGVPHISTRQVQELSFSLPPLSEQHRIVSKVDQLMSLVDELERQQATSREKASNLLDAIVHEMTSGG